MHDDLLFSSAAVSNSDGLLSAAELQNGITKQRNTYV